MNRVVRVSFKQVYDLVFRARSSRLNSTAYVLDFLDWVKAGVAFNTRGSQLSTRKISYFASLYEILQQNKLDGVSILEENRYLLEDALICYYEDIYEIYQDHLKSRHGEAKQKQAKAIPDFGELLILPCFDSVPDMKEVFQVESYDWDKYVCVSPDEFLESANSAYLREETALFKCMSLMYDYGRGHVKRGILLEVRLWDIAQ